MITLAITNLKGGVGKTTTAVNLAGNLGARGVRTLLVDVDSQGQCASYLGVERSGALGQVLTRTRRGDDDPRREYAPTAEFISRGVRPGVDLIACDPSIAVSERLIAGDTLREWRLARRLSEVERDYDLAIMDVGPGVELRSTLALLASRFALVPSQAGTPDTSLTDLASRFSAMRQDAEHAPEILGVVATSVDARERLSRELLGNLAALGLQEAPVIRRNVAVAESTRAGMTVAEYAPKSAGAQDYAALTDWLMTRLEAKA